LGGASRTGARKRGLSVQPEAGGRARVLGENNFARMKRKTTAKPKVTVAERRGLAPKAVPKPKDYGRVKRSDLKVGERSYTVHSATGVQIFRTRSKREA
jgi:hypothetical protein